MCAIVLIAFDSNSLRGQSALRTELVFHFLGPHGVCTPLARVFLFWCFFYVSTFGTHCTKRTLLGAPGSRHGGAGVACSGKQPLGTGHCNLRLSLCLLELLLLLRLFVQLLLLIPGFHKASIADLRLVGLRLLRVVHPHAEKRFGQRLLAIVPVAEPLPSFLWRRW